MNKSEESDLEGKIFTRLFPCLCIIFIFDKKLRFWVITFVTMTSSDNSLHPVGRCLSLASFPSRWNMRLQHFPPEVASSAPFGNIPSPCPVLSMDPDSAESPWHPEPPATPALSPGIVLLNMCVCICSHISVKRKQKRGGIRTTGHRWSSSLCFLELLNHTQHYIFIIQI